MILTQNGLLLPIKLGESDAHLFVVTRIEDVLDLSLSPVIDIGDGRRVCVEDERFTDDAHRLPIFSTPETPSSVFVNDDFVTRVNAASLEGFRFDRVSS